MSPTDSEPMSGDDLAREIANIATKQIIEPTLKDISNQAEKIQMDGDLARHIANLDLQEIPEAKDVTSQDNGPMSFDDFAKEIAKIGNQEIPNPKDNCKLNPAETDPMTEGDILERKITKKI